MKSLIVKFGKAAVRYDYSEFRASYDDSILHDPQKNPNMGHLDDIPCDTYESFTASMSENMRATNNSLPETMVFIVTNPMFSQSAPMKDMSPEDAAHLADSRLYSMYCLDAMDHMIALKKEGKILGVDVPCSKGYLEAGLHGISDIQEKIEAYCDGETWSIDTRNLTELSNEIISKNDMQYESNRCSYERPYHLDGSPFMKEAIENAEFFLKKEASSVKTADRLSRSALSRCLANAESIEQSAGSMDNSYQMY